MNNSFHDHSTSWSVEGSYVKWVAELLIHYKSANESNRYLPILALNTSIYSNIGLLLYYCIVIPLNVFFFASIVPELTRKCIMKLKLLVATIVVANILWSLTWLCLSVAVCIIQETDEVMFILSAEEDGLYLRESIWEIVAHQLIENLLTVQSIVIFAIAIDRYLNLFSSYSVNCENVFAKIFLVILPFIVAATVFDHRVLALILPVESAVFCRCELLITFLRLCLLLCPSLLAITLLLIALFPTEAKNGFEPRFPMSMSTTLPRVMLFVVFLDVFWRVAFFFQLLELDFEFRIVTGSETGDQILQNILNVSYEVLSRSSSFISSRFTSRFCSWFLFDTTELRYFYQHL
ncbi:hypothetical protein OESDEN_00387 [Oesophagostomum dentatum]|uniref:G-protein coupled receptors family 1 profile domain-containing protein n=1 Tax=Oesophagostomum dentatum TaxID=61180 RepID=A0A0B1TU07_OESDE|nr:hypothetical protein OESDEN_00387 [Oesophagostomum dentatum]